MSGKAKDKGKSKQSEDVFADSGKNLRAMLEMASEGVLSTDPGKGTIVFANPAAATIFGYDSPDELLGKSYADFYAYPDQRASILNHLKETGSVTNFEATMVKRDGNRVDVLTTVAAQRDAKGKIFRADGFFTDITERKHAEDEIRKLGNAVEQSIDGIAMSNMEPRLTFVNEAFARMHGYTISEMLGMKVEKIHSKDQQEEFKSRIGQIASEGYWAGEIGHMRKDGSTFPTYMTTTMLKDDDGNPTGIMVVTRDITETKQSEKALERSEAMLRLISENMSDTLLMTDLDFKIQYVNRAEGGFTIEQVIGVPLYMLVDEKDRLGLKTALEKVVRTKESASYETRYARPDGHIVCLESAIMLVEVEGQPSNLVISSRDITERKHAEEQIRLQSELIVHLAEGVNLARLDDGSIIYTNPRFEQMFGYDPGELLGKNISIVNAPDKRPSEQTVQEVIEALNETGEWAGELLNIKKDGTRFWCYANVHVYDHPEYGKVAITAQADITERKYAEKEIWKLGSVVAQSIDGIAIADNNGQITYVNLAYAEMHGYTPREMVEIKLRQLNKRVVSDQYLESTIGDVLNQQDISTMEVEHYRKDGSYFPALISLSFLRDEHGEPAGVVSIANDITQRKRAEEILKQNEERFYSITETAADAIISIDSKRLITFWNESAQKMFGYVMDEVIGKPVDIIIPERFQKAHTNAVKRVVSTGKKKIMGQKVEVAGIRKDGTEFPIELTLADWKMGDEVFFTAIIRDITHRKDDEKEIARLAKFPSENPNPVLRVGEDGVVIYANDASAPLLKHWGCKLNEHLPLDWRKKASNSIKSGVPVTADVEYSSRVMALTLAPISDLSQVNIYGLDVTERRRMEDELQKYSDSLQEMVEERSQQLVDSEQWQRILLASANDAVYAYYRDKNGVASKFIEANAAATQMLGYSREEFLDMTPFNLAPPDDRGKDFKSRRDRLYRDKRVVFESVHATKDGAEIPVEISASLFSYKGRNISLNIVRDITDRKKAEQEIQDAHEKMLRSEKLAAIGQFSSGIAHDLRNPLNVINNAVHLLKMTNENGDQKVTKYLRILEEESAKSNNIISRLMDFARTQTPNLEPVRLYTIINNSLADFLPPDNIEVVLDSAELMASLPDVMVDAEQMGRVFSNIINNAADAMPNGGEITISATADYQYAFVRFKDTGTGIAEQNLAKIFEPLFSTKHAVGGTGIGLAASRAIVDAHRGSIEVKSTEGEGATFTVKLPLA